MIENAGRSAPAARSGRRPLIIETKMNLPRVPHRCVVRPAQIEMLRRGLERRLTLVLAPAGFGKTTLVADVCQSLKSEGMAVAWVSIDRDDDNLAQVGAYVVTALNRATDGGMPMTSKLLAEDPLAPVKLALSVLLNDVAEFARPTVLVLDDFDRLQSPLIHETLFRLLRLAPDNFHVVLTCRAEPALALSYFLMREQLMLLKADQLRFDAEHAQQFLAQVAGMPVSADDARQLLDATEGWAAGLQLAGLSLRGAQLPMPVARSLATTGREVDAYLSENVLAHVPPRTLEFLLSTAVVDRLSPDLCRAVSGCEDAGAILEWLEARNLFIRPVDDAARWYRYHALFRDYLLRRVQRRGKAATDALNKAASTWFAEQALWPEAVQHALAAGETAQAAQWVEQCAMRLVEDGDAATVLAWVARLPPAALTGRLRLRLAHTWALAMTLRTDEVGAGLQAIEAEVGNDLEALDERMRLEVLAVRGVVAALNDESLDALRLGKEISAGRPEEGSWAAEMGHTVLAYGLMYAAHFDEVKRLRDSAPPFPLAHRPVHAQVYRRGVYGLSAWLNGDLQGAARLYEQALAYAESAVGPLSAAAVLPAGYLSLVAYEWNDLDRVAALLHDRLSIGKESGSISAVMGLYLGTARLHALRDDLDAALHWLSQGSVLAERRRWLRMVAVLAAEAVRLELRHGRMVNAQRRVMELETMVPADFPAIRSTVTDAIHSARSARGRVLIAQGEPLAAAAVLEPLVADDLAAGMTYRAARHQVLLALAWAAAGRMPQALQTLTAAMAYGQQQRMLRSFVDEGDAACSLVRALREGEHGKVERWYLDEVLAAFGSRPAPATGAVGVSASVPAPGARLSAREVEILDFIARGLSNKEIARALRVAPETIKWHLKNIYEKLNVSSRVQAVQCGLGVDLPLLLRGERG